MGGKGIGWNVAEIGRIMMTAFVLLILSKEFDLLLASVLFNMIFQEEYLKIFISKIC